MGIIIKPLVTEKMTAITDKLNRFGFIVRPEANKLEIKRKLKCITMLLLWMLIQQDMLAKLKSLHARWYYQRSY